MEYIHDNKPPISRGNSSLFVDMVFWQPAEKDLQPLILYLEETGLGERSQTVEWLTKFTIRLSMWRGKYWYHLTSDEWSQAAHDLIEFVRKVAAFYRPRKIEYDTRAFSVGLAKKVRRSTHPVEDLVQAQPVQSEPVWWYLTV